MNLHLRWPVLIAPSSSPATLTSPWQPAFRKQILTKEINKTTDKPSVHIDEPASIDTGNDPAIYLFEISYTPRTRIPEKIKRKQKFAQAFKSPPDRTRCRIETTGQTRTRLHSARFRIRLSSQSESSLCPLAPCPSRLTTNSQKPSRRNSGQRAPKVSGPLRTGSIETSLRLG
ncbi:MAG: hypothetical protein ACI8P0_002158 [Planctomycetaceae bacterium]|jgi:hypothetical protein